MTFGLAKLRYAADYFGLTPKCALDIPGNAVLVPYLKDMASMQGHITGLVEWGPGNNPHGALIGEGLYEGIVPVTVIVCGDIADSVGDSMDAAAGLGIERAILLGDSNAISDKLNYCDFILPTRAYQSKLPDSVNGEDWLRACMNDVTSAGPHPGVLQQLKRQLEYMQMPFREGDTYTTEAGVGRMRIMLPCLDKKGLLGFDGGVKVFFEKAAGSGIHAAALLFVDATAEDLVLAVKNLDQDQTHAEHILEGVRTLDGYDPEAMTSLNQGNAPEHPVEIAQEYNEYGPDIRCDLDFNEVLVGGDSGPCGWLPVECNDISDDEIAPALDIAYLCALRAAVGI